MDRVRHDVRVMVAEHDNRQGLDVGRVRTLRTYSIYQHTHRPTRHVQSFWRWSPAHPQGVGEDRATHACGASLAAARQLIIPPRHQLLQVSSSFFFSYQCYRFLESAGLQSYLTKEFKTQETRLYLQENERRPCGTHGSSAKLASGRGKERGPGSIRDRSMA